jgi:hypothetical protein
MTKETWKQFVELITTRLTKGVFTTEDSIRYSFFASLLNTTGLKPEDIILEYPHNKIDAEIDTYIPKFASQEVVLEFKYHRRIPSKHPSPKPQKAGEAFNDIRRLIQFQMALPNARYFVYLTDDEMAMYMSNPKNNFHIFFGLTPGQRISIGPQFFTNKSKTFQSAAGGVFVTTLISEWIASLPKQHELRIYRIENGKLID